MTQQLSWVLCFATVGLESVSSLGDTCGEHTFCRIEYLGHSEEARFNVAYGSRPYSIEKDEGRIEESGGKGALFGEGAMSKCGEGGD